MFPTLFRIGPVEVHGYGTLLMVGFVAGILLARREARRMRLSPDLPIDLGVWVLVAGVLFARGVFVAVNWRDYAPYPADALYVWRQGGLSFHGALLGGVLAAILFARRRNISFWSLGDMVAPSVALGYGIARFGCLLNGCCYGVPTTLPWGIPFPQYYFPNQPLHPTQIYAALASFIIMGLLLWARRRLGVPGQLFLLYLMLYSLARSGIEVLRRGASATPIVSGSAVTQAQVASAVIFVVALIWFMCLGRAGRKRTGQRENEAAQ